MRSRANSQKVSIQKHATH